eukprot:NODE_2274_length_494_cov_238.714286_g2257_i0.p1 GENE.NODE_2274_length_494_cov_238.714286_g2257_i0~~NODE_2274_length_494_cov_238.714286_g2257_i0.p1  ORF type:complete len:151 (-),score=26.42 NODE_2274_length_494_cov_238.714286_g2257_i0:41-457(-)
MVKQLEEQLAERRAERAQTVELDSAQSKTAELRKQGMSMGFSLEQIDIVLQTHPDIDDANSLVTHLLALPSAPEQFSSPLNTTAGDDFDLCKVCFERQSNVLFTPCSHLGFCQQCSKAMTECPVCRSPIDQKLPVYRV